jgi:hypothetical protein
MQYQAACFFNDLNNNLTFNYNKNNIKDIYNTKDKVKNTINFIDNLWMDMTYEGKFKKYLDTKAIEYEETELMLKSDYILYDLDLYYIKTKNSKHERNWIYDVELEEIKNILYDILKKLDDQILSYDIRAGVALALLRHW